MGEGGRRGEGVREWVRVVVEVRVVVGEGGNKW